MHIHDPRAVALEKSWARRQTEAEADRDKAAPAPRATRSGTRQFQETCRIRECVHETQL